MVSPQGYEGPLSWLFMHVVLITVPAVACFVVGRRGRLRLWHVALLVLVAALELVPAAACVHLNRAPRSWLSMARMHAAGSPGISVMGLHSPGWGTMLVALSLGIGLGVALFRSGRRDRASDRGPSATPADA